MIHPVLLDARPLYLAAAGGAQSLLQAPCGAATVAHRLLKDYVPSGGPVTVIPDFAVTPAYAEAIAALGDEWTPLQVASALLVDGIAASDWLLLIDARWTAADPGPLREILADATVGTPNATHVVSVPAPAGDRLEHLELDGSQRVVRIQRYYGGANWGYVDGVACSVVSVASLRQRPAGRIESLTCLRTLLAAHGVPTRDVALDGEHFDLRRASGLVRLNEHAAVAACRERGCSPLILDPAAVPRGARVVGPVVIQAGARISPGAVVVGPAVVGAGAVVAEGVVLAQCVVVRGARVPAGTAATARVVLDGATAPTDDLDVDTLPDEPGGPDFVDPERERFLRWKAVVEGAMAALALLVLAPLLAVVAAIIKLDSEGPVFFADVREGLGGRPFRCLKFRTMHVGSNQRQRALRNELDGPQFKLEKDPRLTNAGRYLRPMSLDELPQLVNVVRGEMSLVGPRPSPFRENQICVPWREGRLSVRPGITGLWQVCRHNRRDGDFHQWIYFDLLYVRHMSWWLDLKILMATVLTRGGQTHVLLRRMIAPEKLRA